MANTLGGINTALIAQEGLEAYKAALAPLNALSFDVDDEPMSKGESITTHVITGMSAGAFSGSYITGDTTTTAKTLNLTSHPFRAFHLTDTEGRKTNVDVIMKQAREAAYAVGKKVFQDVTDLFVEATYGTGATNEIVVAVASFDADDVADLADLMDDANIPEENRSLILTNAAYTNLRKDNAIQDASASGSDQALREGAVGRLLGFDVYRTNALTSTVTDENTYGIACHPSTIALAVRPVALANPEAAAAAGTRVETVTDEHSGLSLGFRTFYDNNTGTFWGAFECVHGQVVTQAAGAKRAASA